MGALRDAAHAGDPVVLVTVGTDHHPFPRLVGWVDEWLAGKGDERPLCVIQHGTAPPPRRAEAAATLPYEELVEIASCAVAIVCQAGPASVALCHELGVMPIVVPRSRRHGEHVDDHQVAFARRLGERRRAVVAESGPELAAALDRALAGDGDALPEGASGAPDVEASVARFARHADELLAARRLPLGSRALDRARYALLAGYRPREYDSLRLDLRSSAELRDFVSSARLHNLIRPALNDPREVGVLADKWDFASFTARHGLRAPRTLGRFDRAHGASWSGSPLREPGQLEELLAREQPEGLAVKPVLGVGGRDVVVGEMAGAGRLDAQLGRAGLPLAELVAAIAARPGSGGALIQERVCAHPALREVFAGTLNTIRVHTLIRHDGSPLVERAIARFGTRRARADAIGRGALAAPVSDLERGELGLAYAPFDGPGGSGPHAFHPETGTRIEGLRLPHWPAALELVERAALALPRVRSVGWDVGIAPDGPFLIEGSDTPGPDLAQIASGLLSPPMRAELSRLGVNSPGSPPTVAIAVERLRGRLRRGLGGLRAGGRSLGRRPS